MKLDETVGLLSRIPLFQGLTNEQLNWIALNGEKIIFAKGRDLITEDEAGDAAYLIVNGEASRISGLNPDDEKMILGPGAFIGEMAMLIETEYGSTVTSDGDVRALKFTRTTLRALMTQDPALALHFADKIRERFLHFAGQLKALEQSFSVSPKDVSDLAAAGAEADTQQAKTAEPIN